MKNLILGIIVFVSIIGCNRSKIDHAETTVNEYYIKVEKTNGIDEKQKFSFFVSPTVVDSLKINNAILQRIGENAATYGDWNVKHKRTYKFNEKGMSFISYDQEKNLIRTSVAGIASNAYGVEGDITTVMYFKLDGTQVQDSNGLPDIMSF